MYPETLILGDPTGPLLFFLSAGVALAAAAPIGPISILTIQRAVTMGFWLAFLPTLGAVAGDAVFGVIAALGAGYITSAILGARFWLKLIGSVLLIAMGVKLFSLRSLKQNDIKENFGPWQLGFLNFTLVLSNPFTLTFYLAAFAFLGLSSGHLFARQSFFIGGGIVFGAMTWFVFICTVAGKFHMKVGGVLLGRVRTGIGALFVFLGILSAVSVALGK